MYYVETVFFHFCYVKFHTKEVKMNSLIYDEIKDFCLRRAIDIANLNLQKKQFLHTLLDYNKILNLINQNYKN